MDSTESKPAGWYISSRTPGMERYWTGDFWTNDYRPAQELRGELGMDEEAPTGPPLSESENTNQPSTEDWNNISQGSYSTPPTQTPPAPAGPPPYGYQQPAYGYPQAPYAGATYAVNPHQGIGIVALILAFFVPIAGAIVGHVALSRSKQDGVSTGVPLAAVIIGWLGTAFWLLIWLPFAFLGAALSSYSNHGYSQYDDFVSSSNLETAVELEMTKVYPSQGLWEASCSEDVEFATTISTVCEVTETDADTVTTYPASVTLTGAGTVTAPEVIVDVDAFSGTR